MYYIGSTELIINVLVLNLNIANEIYIKEKHDLKTLRK